MSTVRYVLFAEENVMIVEKRIEDRAQKAEQKNKQKITKFLQRTDKPSVSHIWHKGCLILNANTVWHKKF